MEVGHELHFKNGDKNSVQLMGSGTNRLGSSWSSNVGNWSSRNGDDDDDDDNNNNLSLSTIFT
jgi:hypothetical protein